MGGDIVHKEKLIFSISIEKYFMKEIVDNFINGEFLEPLNKQYLDIFEPATGLVYGKVAESSDYDVKLAVDAAKNAFIPWSKLSLQERSEYLKKIAKEIKHRSENLAQCESKDTGKPITLANKVDIPRAIENFEFFCKLLKKNLILTLI